MKATHQQERMWELQLEISTLRQTLARVEALLEHVDTHIEMGGELSAESLRTALRGEA